MMNSIKLNLSIITALSAAILISASQAHAQSFKDMRIGFVNMQRVLNESVTGKQSKAKLESLVKSKTAEFQAAEKKIISVRSEIESPLLNDDAKRKKIKEIETLQQKYLSDRQNADGEIQQTEAAFTNEIIKDIKDILAKNFNKKYDMILEFATFNTILFKNFEITDITADVIKMYDEQKTN